MTTRYLVIPWKIGLSLLCFFFYCPHFSFGKEPASAPEVESTTLLDFYHSGGIIMHCLLLCSIGTIVIVTYCFLRITMKKMVPKELLGTLSHTIQRGDISHAYTLCTTSPSALTNVLGAALLKVNYERDLANKTSIDQTAMEALDQEETKQMLWVNYLNVFATIAPMIGLLGTVIGMMSSFAQLQRGAADPNDLAGGIGMAMSTTAGGLLVGIPAMFFFFFFRNRVVSIISTIQKEVSMLIDMLTGEIALTEAEPSTEISLTEPKPAITESL